MNTLLLDAHEPGAIERAAQLLRQGEVVVYPTDTLYGIGVNAFSEAAVARLYTVKRRPAQKGIPILLADTAFLAEVAVDVPPLARSLAERFWPGALTLIVPGRPALPPNLSPNSNVAVRVPDDEVARALIRAAGGAVATSSANLSGAQPALEAQEAYQAFAGRIAAVLDGGPVRHGQPSTIVDCTTPELRLLRAGAIPAGQLLPDPA